MDHQRQSDENEHCKISWYIILILMGLGLLLYLLVKISNHLKTHRSVSETRTWLKYTCYQVVTTSDCCLYIHYDSTEVQPSHELKQIVEFSAEKKSQLILGYYTNKMTTIQRGEALVSTIKVSFLYITLLEHSFHNSCFYNGTAFLFQFCKLWICGSSSYLVQNGYVSDGSGHSCSIHLLQWDGFYSTSTFISRLPLAKHLKSFCSEWETFRLECLKLC